MVTLMFMIFFTSFFGNYVHASQTFICGDVKTYALNEGIVQALIFNQALNQGVAPPNQYIQCGLPGLQWKVCSSCETRDKISLLKNVSKMLSSKEHRDWHFYWHSVRRELSFDMNNLPPSNEKLNNLARSGWIRLPEKKNSYEQKDFKHFIRDHAAGGNLAGEDFLYMHRQMIKMLQVELGATGSACIAPWYELPKSSLDKHWPVPRAVHLFEQSKNIQYEQLELEMILDTVANLQDENYLQRVSLNRLGLDIEEHIHGKLHILYAAPSSRCLNPMTDNSIECSDLTHDRSSHVNKYFWKLHGFIDQLIGSWLAANGYKYIYKTCDDSPNPKTCYQWKGTWLGNEPFPINVTKSNDF